MTYYPSIGVVSEGTLRTEDLLDAFASELTMHIKRMRLSRSQRAEYRKLLKRYRMPETWSTGMDEWLVDELQTALSDIAAPYSYFGTAEGDGACFGFWPVDIDESDLPRLESGISAIPREHWGSDILLVNDHGNVDCGYVDKRGKFRAYWSCV